MLCLMPSLAESCSHFPVRQKQSISPPPRRETRPGQFKLDFLQHNSGYWKQLGLSSVNCHQRHGIKRIQRFCKYGAESRTSVGSKENTEGQLCTPQLDMEHGIDENLKQQTLRLVECAMLAATCGLAYFLSTLLRLESYLGCFFPLPVVISSMRWGASAGRKTMIATAVLLLILSGPLRAASYLLIHGFLGLTMGSLWRWEARWSLSILACTVVRSIGALGFVLLSSWLLQENILQLITVNAHASVSYMLAALGINIVPTMGIIHLVFVSLLLVNSGSFVFLLHVLYAIFLRRLGIKTTFELPAWIERAM